MTVVDLDKLYLAMGKLVEFARQREQTVCELGDRDGYWCIHAPDRLDLDQEPGINVGSIAHDLARVEKVIAGESPHIGDLDCIADLLLVVSEALAPSHGE